MATVAPTGWTDARRPLAVAAEPWRILLAFAVAAALVQSFLIPIDADVSWLITVSEQVLAGKRLYGDIFEVNPPASVWLYVPPVWLAQLTGVRPEAMVAGAAIGLALAVSAITLRLSARLSAPPPPAALAGALGFTTLLLPGGLFAQREHFALLLALPALTALALAADRQPLGRYPALATGFAAGLVAVLKPHFMLALLPAAIWACWRMRSVPPIVPGAVAATAVLAAYGAAVLLATPAYLDYLPLLSSTYLPMREQWPRLLIGPCVLIPAISLGLAALLRPVRVPPFAGTLLLGMLGFAAAALIQGKGYANHALPGRALGLLGLTLFLTTAAATPERRRLIAAASAVFALVQLGATARILPPPGLVEALRQVAPPNPTMITLGTELTTAHPAVRNVDGRWVGSRASLFTVAGVQYRRPAPLPPAERAQLERWYREDIRSFADDVAAGRPDVVLVEASEKRWIAREPVLVTAMRPYRFAVRAGTIEIWLRR